MPEQNIYDNEIFFNEYKALRDSGVNFNELLEQPAMEKLLPDLKGKTVLDLGCGYGKNSRDFIVRGASQVTAVDISEKMLKVAKAENSDPNIEYKIMSMSDISALDKRYDFVYSSLAFHYIKNFEKLIQDIYNLLNFGGTLLFSQEHPLITSTEGGRHFHGKNEKGEYTSFTFSDYGNSGKRDTFWYVEGVEKYHRRFSDIINALSGAGFIIENVTEPLPSDKATDKLPALKKEFIKPTFLIVRARKGN